MSDYNDLIRKLRSYQYGRTIVLEAANALEAQANLIFKLEKAYQEAREELTAAYMCGYERAKSEYAARKSIGEGR